MLGIKFAKCFGDLRKLVSQFDILESPFATAYEKVPDALQLELVDLQCNSSLKEDIFNRSERIDKFFWITK